jgi:hypothetical protein
VLTAVFSFESPFQQFGFEQPNIAIAHAPFNLLPAVVVALVLFSHLVVLWRLAVVKESFQEFKLWIKKNLTRKQLVSNACKQLPIDSVRL